MLLRDATSIPQNGRTLWYHGNRELLDERLHAVLCSKACPGDKIIEAIDLAQYWRAENRAVLSGFHTAVEKECLRIFLRGPQLIVICSARGGSEDNCLSCLGRQSSRLSILEEEASGDARLPRSAGTLIFRTSGETATRKIV